MELNEELCYRALRSKDERFDGRFFTGVRSTGIYCRPICPARTPLRRNLTFFKTAAAAEEAGFRACLRCRPESTPGTPDWMPSCDTVSRALRRIQAGGLDELGAAPFAAGLGVSERHLHRLFRRHLGASPARVARSRRAHFARRLIGETSLSMTQVAFSAGYGSIRRFNAAIQATFGKTPTELRRRPGRAGAAEDGQFLALELPYRPPYRLTELLSFLRPRCVPGVEQVLEDGYLRTFRTAAGPAWFEVRALPVRPALELRVPASLLPDLFPISERVQTLFDLRADPAVIAEQLAQWQPAGIELGPPGLRLPGAFDGYELGVRAILGQQVSVRGATTLAGRLVERYGEACDLRPACALDRLFPEPSRLAGADLCAIGLPRARARAISCLSERVAAGRLELCPGADPEEVRGALSAIPGIGPWTADYICMRALSHPDSFPCADLGLRRAASRTGEPITAAQLDRLSQAWRPWRSYAALALWQRLSPPGVP